MIPLPNALSISHDQLAEVPSNSVTLTLEAYQLMNGESFFTRWPVLKVKIFNIILLWIYCVLVSHNNRISSQ